MTKPTKTPRKKATLNLSIDENKKKKLQKLAIDKGNSSCDLVEEALLKTFGI